MPPKKRNVAAKCKYCKMTFDVDPDPCSRDPGPDDVVRRRCVNSRDCKHCYPFIRFEEDYGEMSADALVEHLEDPKNQEKYDQRLEQWCKTRREGGRRGRGRGETTATAEQSSALETKQVLGYLWSVPLLKKHEREVPRKLQSVQHQGKTVKGAILPEWVLGCIEVASTSAKTARHVTELADGGSDDDNAAANAYESACKKVRISASEKDDEITLKMPGKTGCVEEDEIMALMWGSSASAMGGGSDDEKDVPVSKKRKQLAGGASGSQARRKTEASKGTSKGSKSKGTDGGSSVDGPAGSGGLFGFGNGGKPKKGSTAETKDLDKSEALVLQVSQMKLQLEEPRGFANLNLAKATSLLEKVDSRLNDSSKLFLEMIRAQGPGCRAETVLQSLKDSKSLISAMADLLEALQDGEASPETLRLRAGALRGLGVELPMQVSNIICQRSLVAMVEEDKVEDAMKFLDMSCKDEHPDGICCVVPSSLSEDAQKLVVTEFQAGCVVHLVNQHFLRDFSGNDGPDSEARKTYMDAGLAKVLDLINAFMKSNIYETAAPGKSPLRDDLVKLARILSAACNSGSMSSAEVDSVDAAKASIIKTKGHFQSALTIYPTGAYLCEILTKKIGEIRKDELLQAEVENAAEYAKSLKNFTRESITKEREGDWDVTVPSQNKFADMVAKYGSFLENSSARCRASCAAHLAEIEQRIGHLREVLAEAGSFKAEKKFPKFIGMLDDLLAKKLGDEKTPECLQLLGEIAAYNFFPKVPLAKLLGKESVELEEQFAVVNSTARLLQAAFGKLWALASGHVNESVLMDEKFISFFHGIKDEKAMNHLQTILPAWATSLDKVKEMIQSALATFLTSTTSTFHGFIGKILDTEMKVEMVLDAAIVGTLDFSEDKDAKAGFDYVKFYHAYRTSLRTIVSIPAPNSTGEGELKLHASFLCLGGILLSVSKYLVSFWDKTKETTQLKSFKDLAEIDFELVKKKQQSQNTYKIANMISMCSHFAKMSAVCSSFKEISKGMDDGEPEMVFFKKLTEKVHGFIVQVLSHCNDELGSAWTLLDSSFKTVQKAHTDYPSMFQAEKLDKSKIHALASDPATQYLLFLGPKCANLALEIKNVLDGTQIVLKHVDAPQSILTMTSALKSDLETFSSTSQPGLPKEDAKIVLANFSFFQGSCTLGQCLTRDLSPGETRLSLAKRCIDVLVKKGIKFEINLQRRVEALNSGK